MPEQSAQEYFDASLQRDKETFRLLEAGFYEASTELIKIGSIKWKR